MTVTTIVEQGIVLAEKQEKFDYGKLRIEDYLASRGHYPTKKYGNYWMYLCPLHLERDPSFAVYPDTQQFKCFGCGQTGTIAMLVQQMEGLPNWPSTFSTLREIVGETDNHVSIPKVRERQTEPIIRTRNAYASVQQQLVLDTAATWWHEQLIGKTGRRAYSYLLTRGGMPSVLQQPNVGYSPYDPDGATTRALCAYLTERLGTGWQEHARILCLIQEDGQWTSRLQNRVLFFCRNNTNRPNEERHVMYYHARTLSTNPEVPRYMGPGGIRKYPLILPVTHPTLPITIAAESPFASLALASRGLSNLATLGNGIDADLISQLALQAQVFSPIAWAQDNDVPRIKLRGDGTPMMQNGEVMYEQAGEIQARLCLQKCMDRGISGFRIVPPRFNERQNGIDDWMINTARSGFEELVRAVQTQLAQFKEKDWLVEVVQTELARFKEDR